MSGYQISRHQLFFYGAMFPDTHYLSKLLSSLLLLLLTLQSLEAFQFLEGAEGNRAIENGAIVKEKHHIGFCRRRKDAALADAADDDDDDDDMKYGIMYRFQ
uniref:Uncharacterized protein n=1 Tax=Syphacia muris TaxID=451379 RepID=A0A0N5ANS6_9BILA